MCQLSSAHVYLRLSGSVTWDNGIPQNLLDDAAQVSQAKCIFVHPYPLKLMIEALHSFQLVKVSSGHCY